jgi:hypothetical protein
LQPCPSPIHSPPATLYTHYFYPSVQSTHHHLHRTRSSPTKTTKSINQHFTLHQAASFLCCRVFPEHPSALSISTPNQLPTNQSIKPEAAHQAVAALSHPRIRSLHRRSTVPIFKSPRSVAVICRVQPVPFLKL